jgi:phospholipase C
MKSHIQYSLVELCRRAAGITTAAAMLLSPAAPVLATPNNQGKPLNQNSLERLQHIIVIYQENWSFDSLYGQFPGASGYAYGFDTLPQYDKSTNYTSLIYKTAQPRTGFPLAPDPQFPASADGNLGTWFDHTVALPLIPYDFTNYIDKTAKTGDIIHRFYHEQLQIDNGLLEPKKGDLDKFVTWSDNPGLVLSYLDATNFPEGQLAQQYTLCDNFFHSAYGGSFLNHQWLISANSPPWTAPIPLPSWISTYDPATKTLNDAQLSVDSKYGVNTIQPLLAPFSPGTAPNRRL